jgi:hypothetical protein
MNRSIKQNSAFFGKKIGDVIQGNFTNNRYIICKEVLGWDKWSLSRIRVISEGGQPKLHIDRLINTQFKSEIFNYIDEIEEEYSQTKTYLDSRLQSGLLSKEEYAERLGGSI